MIYRFTIISDEVDDFVREIQIDPEATFYDFHEAILKSVGYANDQMTSFFICDDDWEKEKEENLVFYPAGSPIPREITHIYSHPYVLEAPVCTPNP